MLGTVELQVIFSLGAVVATVLMQMAGLTLIAELLVRRGTMRRHQHSLSWQTVTMGAVVCLLFVLHLLQITLYALLYWLSGDIAPFSAALYFSAVTFATIGYGDITMEEPWRLFAALEGLNGVILVGWSVSFLVAIVRWLGLWTPRQ